MPAAPPTRAEELEVGTHHVRYHALVNLHSHDLNSMAILYREDRLSFLGERWSYHLGKHTMHWKVIDKYMLMKTCTQSVPLLLGH